MPAGEQQEPVFNWSPLPQRKYLTRKHEVRTTVLLKINHN